MHFIRLVLGLGGGFSSVGGWGFSSVVEHLPSKLKALGLVLSSEKKKEKKKTYLGHGVSSQQ